MVLKIRDHCKLRYQRGLDDIRRRLTDQLYTKAQKDPIDSIDSKEIVGSKDTSKDSKDSKNLED